jgi:hypothetical protein
MVTKPLNIVVPRYCACCWRPITEKNKKGRPVNYCAMHKPEGSTKRNYMRARRTIEKVLADELGSTEILKVKLGDTDKLNKIISTLAADPISLSFADINSGKSLIKELLNITSNHYKIAFEKLKELGDYVEQSNLSIELVLLATHVAMGTHKEDQARSEISAYDTKKVSNIWYMQVLYTVARYEAFVLINKRAAIRRTRKDKNLTLRARIKKVVDIAEGNNKKPNQSEIATKLKRSKQRVGKLIKEIYPGK